MALTPAHDISRQLTGAERALPIFKVLYRNTARIQKAGRAGQPSLHETEPAKVSFEARA